MAKQTKELSRPALWEAARDNEIMAWKGEHEGNHYDLAIDVSYTCEDGSRVPAKVRRLIMRNLRKEITSDPGRWYATHDVCCIPGVGHMGGDQGMLATILWGIDDSVAGIRPSTENDEHGAYGDDDRYDDILKLEDFFYLRHVRGGDSE